jgi:hypothetical protein
VPRRASSPFVLATCHCAQSRARALRDKDQGREDGLPRAQVALHPPGHLLRLRRHYEAHLPHKQGPAQGPSEFEIFPVARFSVDETPPCSDPTTPATLAHPNQPSNQPPLTASANSTLSTASPLSSFLTVSKSMRRSILAGNYSRWPARL